MRLSIENSIIATYLQNDYSNNYKLEKLNVNIFKDKFLKEFAYQINKALDENKSMSMLSTELEKYAIKSSLVQNTDFGQAVVDVLSVMAFSSQKILAEYIDWLEQANKQEILKATL